MPPNFSDYPKVVNVFNNITNISRISTAEMSALTFITSEYSDEVIKLATSQMVLTKEQATAIFAAKELSGAELDAAVKTATLSASQTAATATTGGLSTATKGLWSTMKAHPMMVVTAAIGLAIGAYSKWKQVQEENRQAAEDAAKTYADTSKSIDEYAKKYEELHTALLEAKGNEEETYNIKKQLLELQTELNEKFGDEYGKLNLVTDAYKDQTDVVKAFNKESANRFLNETPGLDIAEREMTRNRDYFLGSTGNMNEQYAKDIYDIVSRYQGKGIELEKLADKNVPGYTIKFVGDATEANEVINELETEIRKLQALGICVGKLYKESYRAVGDVLLEILELLN